MITRPVLPHGRFAVIAAARAGYAAVLADWRYIAAVAVVPFITSVIVTLASLYAPGADSLLSQFMLSLPSVFMSGWFMFLLMRLAIFGERLDTVDALAPAKMAERSTDMRASVLIWILVNMAVTLGIVYVMWAADVMGVMAPDGTIAKTPATPTPAQNILGIVNMFLLAFSFWSVRLTILHLLAAVGYPLKRYMYAVNGLGFSARLIGLAALCFLPGLFAQQIIIYPFFDGSRPFSQIGPGNQAAVALITSAVSLVTTAIMTLSTAAALKDCLGRGQKAAA